MEESSTSSQLESSRTYVPVCENPKCSKLPGLVLCSSCRCELCAKCLDKSRLTESLVQCPVHQTIFCYRQVDDDESPTSESEENVLNESENYDETTDKQSSKDETTLVCCPLECGKDLISEELLLHLSRDCIHRFIDCKHCNKTIKLSSAKDHEEKQCRMISIPCEYCEMKMKRCELKRHLDTCNRKIVKCKYSLLHCHYEDEKINMINHERIERHSSHLMRYLSEQNTKIFKMREEITKLKEDLKEWRSNYSKASDNQTIPTEVASISVTSGDQTIPKEVASTSVTHRHQSTQTERKWLGENCSKEKKISVVRHGKIIGKWSNRSNNKLKVAVYCLCVATVIVILAIYLYWY
ncbi:TNF receptor-associated factor 5-like [Centruroides sculpturatus]|uniref:TNF receptor-associated factor 5-like n=1 Tax=Centruroides sculpturatus TaxID=218467 RepID=UPI000C6EFBC7|nr:TNF receptor-associated factor 5-like [Centruroides sculpturatus]